MKTRHTVFINVLIFDLYQDIEKYELNLDVEPAWLNPPVDVVNEKFGTYEFFTGALSNVEGRKGLVV